jgi:hypothetical protein
MKELKVCADMWMNLSGGTAQGRAPFLPVVSLSISIHTSMKTAGSACSYLIRPAPLKPDHCVSKVRIDTCKANTDFFINKNAHQVLKTLQNFF